jgi:hypothetical protein
VQGDVDDLLRVLFPKDPNINPDWTQVDPSEAASKLAQRGKCRWAGDARRIA